MKIVVDANVFFSALIREGLTRRMLFSAELIPYAPAFAVREFLKHEETLFQKYSGERQEFRELTGILLERLNLVSDAELKPFLPAAKSFSPDQNDELYFACALYVNCGIWSNDKVLKKQNRVEVKTAGELAGELGYV